MATAHIVGLHPYFYEIGGAIGTIAITAWAGFCLAGCAPPEGPGPQAAATPCELAAAIIGNPYSTPGNVELALESYRTKCLGSTPDGSRQLRPAPVAKTASTEWATDEDMFKADMRAVQ
jgi:hypothetical protein